MPPTVQENLRQIYARGQNLGRNPYRFSKLGDSTILKPLLLARFDEGGFDLGPYAHLQPVINYYAGSYERVGLAAREALHSWSIFDPLWANKTWCEPNETMLECEFRYNNPAILIVRLGSNDSGAPTGFAANLRQVIQFALDQGIIPVLATTADRFEGEENTNNEIIRRTAREFQLPLWEFDRVADHLPGRGLGEDGIHLVVDDRLHDYSDPAIMASGHAVQNLTALMTLAEVWEAVNAEQP